MTISTMNRRRRFTIVTAKVGTSKTPLGLACSKKLWYLKPQIDAGAAVIIFLFMRIKRYLTPKDVSVGSHNHKSRANYDGG